MVEVYPAPWFFKHLLRKNVETEVHANLTCGLGTQSFKVKRAMFGRHAFERTLFFHFCAPTFAQSLPQFRRIQNAFQRVGECVRIAWRHQNSASIVFNEARNAADVGCDNRFGRRQTFHERNRRAFLQTRQSHNIEGPVEARDVGAKPQKMRVMRQTQLAR